MTLLFVIGFFSLALSIYICRPMYKSAFSGFKEAASTLEQSVEETLPEKSYGKTTRHELVREEGIQALCLMILGPSIPMLVLASLIFFGLLALKNLLNL